MIIRPATREDQPVLVKLLQECDLYNPDLDYSEWSHPTLVAETLEGEVVGMVQALNGRPYAYMTEICVRPDWQDKGVASLLVASIEGILKSCGVGAWVGVAIDANTNSRARMEHKGGRPTRTGIAYIKVIA